MTTQTEPIEDGHDDASDGDKLTGLVEQTRQDVLQGHVTDPADALRQRLTDASLDVDEQTFAELLAEITA